jgi:DNA-binding ferritin-like protein
MGPLRIANHIWLQTAAILPQRTTLPKEFARSAARRCDADYAAPMDMLAELRDDNKQLTVRMRETHDLCDEHGDVATACLPENWVDEAERRTWFLFEMTRNRG